MNDSSPMTPEQRVAHDQQVSAGRQNYYLAGPQCLDEQQMAVLRTYVDQYNAPAEVSTASQGLSGGSQYMDARRTAVCSLDPANNAWIYGIIEQCFLGANQQMGFDIVPSVNEPIQLLRYDAEESGHFRWHADTSPSDMTRKISLIVPLNNPDEYDGGELQFNQGGIVNSIDQVAGRAYAFPSWLIHQVTPVTRGVRYSLVSWIRGPSWR